MNTQMQYKKFSDDHKGYMIVSVDYTDYIVWFVQMSSTWCQNVQCNPNALNNSLKLAINIIFEQYLV